MWAFINFHACNMRKSLSILLLTVLLIYMGGYHLWYALYKVHLKAEMHQYIVAHPDAKAACHFVFNLNKAGHIGQNNFKWEEKNKEFKWMGMLYDVITITYNQTTVTICCLPDNAENNTDLFHLALQKSRNDAGKQNRLSFSQIFSFFYAPQHLQINPILVAENVWFITSFSKHSNPPAFILQPPPRIDFYFS